MLIMTVLYRIALRFVTLNIEIMKMFFQFDFVWNQLFITEVMLIFFFKVDL